MANIKSFIFNDLMERSYLIWDETGECVIVDPGFSDKYQKESLIGFIQTNGLTPVKVLLTHGHFDHTLGLRETVRIYHIPVMMHPDDRETLENVGYFRMLFGADIPDTYTQTTDIHDGDTIEFGNSVFEVIATPGHTPGGVCYLDRKNRILLSGDTLFAGSIGRTDHPAGDYDKLMESIFTKLMVLDGDINVYPGHGHDTTIADERMKNPFLLPFNMPEEESE